MNGRRADISTGAYTFYFRVVSRARGYFRKFYAPLPLSSPNSNNEKTDILLLYALGGG